MQPVALHYAALHRGKGSECTCPRGRGVGGSHAGRAGRQEGAVNLRPHCRALTRWGGPGLASCWKKREFTVTLQQHQQHGFGCSSCAASMCPGPRLGASCLCNSLSSLPLLLPERAAGAACLQRELGPGAAGACPAFCAWRSKRICPLSPPRLRWLPPPLALLRATVINQVSGNRLHHAQPC
jgi:hypothetical protein